MSGHRVPLRVGMNLTWLVPGVVGGSEDYVVGLLGALADSDPSGGLGQRAEVVLFVNRSFASAHPHLAAAFEVVTAPVSGRSKAVRVVGDNTWLPWALGRAGLDAVHHVGGVVPFVGARRRGGRARGRAQLVCIHDLQPLDLPANFSPLKRRFEAVAIPWSVHHSDRITTLGEWVATSVAERFSVQADRVSIVAPGAPRPDAPHDGGAAPADDEALVRLGVGAHPFVLYPAITYPHKNHRVLIDAMTTVHERHPEVRLVLCGGRATAEEALADRVESAGLGPVVVRTGRVASGDLGALYRGATAMVFPSRYEGFGLPVLEAMQQGCPVIASTSGALPGVVGDAGILVDPDDAHGWADAVVGLLEDPGARRDLVAAGRRRAATYTWHTGAEALVGAWERAVAYRRGTT